MTRAHRCPLARGVGSAVAAIALSAVAVLGHVPAARADDRPGTRLPAVPQVVRQECASCHIVYPPGLLPAASWQRLLSDLPHHFGTDASVDAASLAELNAWFAANAGASKRVKRDATPPPEDRITRAAWFRREHDEVPAATWRLPSVRTPANCAACHTRADEGDFRERFVRLPR